MPPTTVLIYGNPEGGTPLMIAAPDFALELPLRVLVREEVSKTYVTLNSSNSFEGKHDLPPGMATEVRSSGKAHRLHGICGSSGQITGRGFGLQAWTQGMRKMPADVQLSEIDENRDGLARYLLLASERKNTKTTNNGDTMVQ